MRLTTKSLYKFIGVIAGVYIFLLTLLYFFQEKLLFHPQVLEQDHQFSFDGDYREIFIPVEEDVRLHGLLFKAPDSKGLVFYLHGNSGCADGWGRSAALYTMMRYDLFLLDYRGYGKSGGHIQSEAQLLQDVQKAYQFIMKDYDESNIVIAGYSIGTGPASYLASVASPKALLLQAPYYSLATLIDEKVPMVPGFVTKYKLQTCEYLKNVDAPVFLFHGTNDKLIPYSHSEKLLERFKDKCRLIPLEGEGHNAINESYEYAFELEKCLSGL